MEEYDPAKFKEFFDLQINTALSQTLVIDNFIVQETRSLQFTIDYLIRLHEKVVENHKVRLTFVCVRILFSIQEVVYVHAERNASYNTTAYAEAPFLRGPAEAPP